MDRQAAYDLFTAFLRRRQIKGIDLEKDLPSLLQHAISYGFFANPHTVHELSEWRKYGDRLWELVLDEDKPAKKMSKLWKIVQNELLMSQAEKRAAQGTQVAQDRNRAYGVPWSADTPTPPTFTTINLPSSAPSAPPCEDSGVVAGGSGETVPSPSPPSFPASESPVPVPGVESGLAEAMARGRQEMWTMLGRQGMEEGDSDLIEAANDYLAFPVLYTPAPQGGLNAEIRTLDWKMLAQLRATVGSYGVTSEPVRQMMDYLFNAHILLPADIKGIARLIYSPHQLILFNAHWHQEAMMSAAVQRGPGDPLHGVTLEQLMGLGAWTQVEAQATSGPDVCREAMTVARRAMDKIKTPGGTPIYMGIRQGTEEALGTFVDKVMEAITKARVPEYMQGALLKQCVLQNGNPSTWNLISTMPGDWGVPELLEKAASVPSGSQALLVSAIQKLGDGLKEQARVIQEQSKAAHTQVLAALAPLQAAASTSPRPHDNTRMRCFCCGALGHVRRECWATGVWCGKCQSTSHSATVCRRRPGNGKNSAHSGRAQTQMAAAVSTSPDGNNPNMPPEGASAWTWQPQ
ncbi:hypothetical protein CIB84_015810 [Bambusicola thoracicus]|uniref:CCHC-type domain-containing protein n=1 Tax=Bambusicola thoracicus TaxID=9083 RepID=A0A2P4S8J7_BAMTH|nr:hypothetical protein CIB84_015810 [Bambusicola thoracicus]